MNELLEVGIELIGIYVVLDNFNRLYSKETHSRDFRTMYGLEKEKKTNGTASRLTCCRLGLWISLGIIHLGPVSPAKPHLCGLNKSDIRSEVKSINAPLLYLSRFVLHLYFTWVF